MPVYIPPPPLVPDRSQQVDRHLGMWCGCPLLDCCHHEWPEYGTTFRTCASGRHVDSGSPQSGYLLPWEPGDESWRDLEMAAIALRGSAASGESQP